MKQVKALRHLDMPRPQIGQNAVIDRSANARGGRRKPWMPALAMDGSAADLARHGHRRLRRRRAGEVEVHESNDPNAEPIVDLYCNGIPQRIVRGQPIAVKRKYVQILAGARQVSMSTDTRVQGEDVINRVSKRSALRYPFSVVRDDNRKGRDWLRTVLQAA